MRTVLRVGAGVDDSQRVELRDHTGMAVTVLTLQQCWIALPAARARDDARRGRNCTLRRMGGANGSRECAPDDRLRETHHRSGQQWMGIAALHPSNRSRSIAIWVRSARL